MTTYINTNTIYISKRQQRRESKRRNPDSEIPPDNEQEHPKKMSRTVKLFWIGLIVIALLLLAVFAALLADTNKHIGHRHRTVVKAKVKQ